MEERVRKRTGRQENRLADGGPVFSRDELVAYSSYRKYKTAAELIAFIENALRNRRPDAPELA